MNPAPPDGPLHGTRQPGACAAISERHIGTRQLVAGVVIGPGLLTAPPPGLDHRRRPCQGQGRAGRRHRDGELVQLTRYLGACVGGTVIGVLQLQDGLDQRGRERAGYVVPLGQ